MAIFTGVPQVLVYTSIVIFYQNKLTCFIFTEIASIPFLLSFTLTFHMDPFVNPQTIDCMKCTITLVTLISAFLVVYQFMSPHTAGGEKHTVTLAAFNFSFSFVMCLAVLIDSKWIIACKVTIVAFVWFLILMHIFVANHLVCLCRNISTVTARKILSKTCWMQFFVSFQSVRSTDGILTLVTFERPIFLCGKALLRHFDKPVLPTRSPLSFKVCPKLL